MLRTHIFTHVHMIHSLAGTREIYRKVTGHDAKINLLNWRLTTEEKRVTGLMIMSRRKDCLVLKNEEEWKKFSYCNRLPTCLSGGNYNLLEEILDHNSVLCCLISPCKKNVVFFPIDISVQAGDFGTTKQGCDEMLVLFWDIEHYFRGEFHYLTQQWALFIRRKSLK